MTDAPPARRRILGAALRRFRAEAGCTLDDAARILDCRRSKISRIETGQRGIRGTDLRELLAEYGVDDPRRDALLSLARKPRQDGWWQSTSHVRGDAYPGFTELGGAGTTVGTYDAQLLPGLLQTRDYARAIAAASGPFVIVTFPGTPDLAVVCLEGHTGGICLDGEDEVARYTLAFEHLRATALPTVATVSLIKEIAADT